MDSTAHSNNTSLTARGRLKKTGFVLAMLALVGVTVYFAAAEYSQLKDSEIAAQESIFQKYQVSPALLKLNPDFASERWETDEDWGCAWRHQSCVQVKETFNIMQGGKVSQVTCKWLVTMKPYANGKYLWDTQEITDIEPTNTEARELYEPLNAPPTQP